MNVAGGGSAQRPARWHFRLADIEPAPWKNGGGVTREIAAWPPGAGLDDFVWRVSAADIEIDGPFSAFPGIDRHIMLLEGNGVRLRAEDGSFDVLVKQPGSPFKFRGELPVRSWLIRGPSRDLNVMTRREHCKAEIIASLSAFTVLADANPVLLMPILGVWVSDRHPDPIRPGEGVFLAEGSGELLMPRDTLGDKRCVYITFNMDPHR